MVSNVFVLERGRLSGLAASRYCEIDGHRSGKFKKYIYSDPGQPGQGGFADFQTGHLYKLNKDKPNNKKEKKPYGEFGMIFLTDEELFKLQLKYPDTWEDWIRRVDRGNAMKGYKYKNDYARILSWIDKEEKEETQKAFEELMAEAEYMSPHYGIYQ